MNTVKTISDALTRSSNFVRPYMQKVVKTEFFEPPFARFRLVVYFKKELNKKAKWYPSYDYVDKDGSEPIRNEWDGLFKLMRLGKEKLEQDNRVKSVVIYATTEHKPITAESNYNVKTWLKTKFKEEANQKVAFNHRQTFFLIP